MAPSSAGSQFLLTIILRYRLRLRLLHFLCLFDCQAGKAPRSSVANDQWWTAPEDFLAYGSVRPNAAAAQR